MAVNVPLILINDLPEQEIPTDDVYLIIGGNDAKKVKVSNLSEYLKKSVTYYFLLPMLSIYNQNNNKNFHRIDNRSIFNIFIEILVSFYTPQ